jgi:hypothetical protein
MVSGQQSLELAPKEKVDPRQQDRRHAVRLAPSPGTSNAANPVIFRIPKRFGGLC